MYPNTPAELLEALTILEANINTYQIEVGATAEDIKEINNFRANLATVLNNADIVNADKQTMTQIKKAVYKGNPAAKIPSYPPFELIPLPFPDQKAGADQFYRKIKARYKTAQNYTKEIGTALGFEKSSSEKVSPDQLVAALKLADAGNHQYVVNFAKQGQNGLLIQDRPRGTEKWRDAKTALMSPVTINAPEPSDENAAVQLEVRGRLLKGNIQVGKWSPIYLLTVTT